MVRDSRKSKSPPLLLGISPTCPTFIPSLKCE